MPLERQPNIDNPKQKALPIGGERESMSEGYTIEGSDGETVGLVVRQAGERGFRFHASVRDYEGMDGHVFVSPKAAERAARDYRRATRHWRRSASADMGGTL